MFWKFLRESLWRPGSRHHALWAVLSVASGTAIAAAMLSVTLDIGDRVGKELRSLGANIVITPVSDSLPVEIGGMDYRPVSAGSYLAESSLPKLKEIFWRNNIVAFAPFLYVSARAAAGTGRAGDGHEAPGKAPSSTILVGTWFNHSFSTSDGARFQTGVRELNPAWEVDGAWIDDAPTGSAAASGPQNVCLVGRSLARALTVSPGSVITLEAEEAGGSDRTAAGLQSGAVTCTVKGVLSTGGAEDNQIFTTLALAQAVAGLPGKARKVQASALIKPETSSSRRDPQSMTAAEYERWYCSPYLSSILHQIAEALPETSVRPVQPVAETEGKVLGKIEFFMALLAVGALLAAALSISSIASIRVLKRRQEISLMKAIGAPESLIAALFLTEAALQGTLGAALGFVAGLGLARILERMVFGSDLVVNWIVLPVILAAGLAVSFAGTWGPLKLAMSYEPASVLRGE